MYIERGKYGKHIWTPEAEEFLRKNYISMTSLQLAKELGITRTITRTKLYSMGLKKMEPEYWTDEQVQMLRDNYKQLGDVEMAELFSTLFFKKKGWTKSHIDKKRKQLGLFRTEEEVRIVRERNARQKRYSTVNKRWATVGVIAVGEIRIWNSHGRKIHFIKTKKGFVWLARYNWIKEFGAVQRGCVIVKKDISTDDHTVSNLECITRAELIKRSKSLENNNYIAATLSWKDKELREIIKKEYPDLIELKRNQLKLNRSIKDAGKR